MTKWVYFVNETRPTRSSRESSERRYNSKDGATEARYQASILSRFGVLKEIVEREAPSIIGYAATGDVRVGLEGQASALEANKCSYVIEDVLQPEVSRRSGFNALKSVLMKGDVLCVWRLDRLGLSLLQLLELVSELGDQGIEMRLLEENVNLVAHDAGIPTSAVRTLVNFERTRLSVSTRAGMLAAEADGRHAGRPKLLSDDQLAAALRAVDEEGKPVAAVAKRFGVHPRTLYRALHDLRRAQSAVD